MEEEEEETGGMQQQQQGILEEIHSQRRREERSLYPTVGFLQYPTTEFFVESAQQLESLNTEQQQQQQQQQEEEEEEELSLQERRREKKRICNCGRRTTTFQGAQAAVTAVCRLESVSRTSSSFFVGSCCFHFQEKQRKISILYDHLQLRVGAIVLMVLSLWCLGSWPAFFNVLERRGRVPMHTYMDYTIATYCVAIGFALTLGEIGPSSEEYPNFTTQLFQDNGPSVAFAMAGGLALCLGNISMQYSLAFVGISLTEVVSASLAVVVGTSVNYFLDGGMNCAVILFPGVACFLVAVVLGSFCHASNAADITLKLNSKQIVPYRSEDVEETTMNVDFTDCVNAKLLNKQCFTEGIAQVEEGKGSCSSEEWGLETAEAAVGSAEFLQNLEDHRAIKIKGRSVGFGLGIALFTGGCYALFSPLFNLATNDQFHLLKLNVPHLVVYTTFFYFSTSFFICAMVINIYLLYHPLVDIPKSSLRAYLRDWKGRDLAVLAGLVCGFGNGFQFMGGQAAGYAAADAVQALPLVGTLWGILLFGEYHKSSRRTYTLLSAMLIMFGIAVTLLIASSRQRD